MTDEATDAACAGTDQWGWALRPVGLAPASTAGYAPDRIVETAAAAGFDFVGLRVAPGSPGAPRSPAGLVAGSTDSRRTAAALAATGLNVLDIDGIVLDDRVRRGDWLAALDAAAEIGARIATVTVPVGTDRESPRDRGQERALGRLRAFAADALALGIVPAVEPAAYGGPAALAEAAALARAAECLVLPDALHYHRSGATPTEAAGVADVAVMLQLSDAPAAVPGRRAGRLAEARGHRLLPGDGAADLPGFLAAFPADLPVSVEVRHPALERLGLEAAVRELYAAGRACLEALTLPDTLTLAGLV